MSTPIQDDKVDRFARRSMEIIRWRREVHLRLFDHRQSELKLMNAQELLEIAILEYNKELNDAGSESKTENQAAT